MGESQPWITEPGRQVPLWGSYEVVVLGGGPAGIAAAAAAGRSGRSTILIERHGYLGGSGTAAGVSTFGGLHANVHGDHRVVVHGLAGEILKRIERLDGLKPAHLSLQGKIMSQAFDISAYKIAAEQIIADAGAEMIYLAFGAGAVMRSATMIDALLVETKSGRFAVRGEVFIDCSGDADLAAWAGAPYEMGDGKGAMMYPTTMFRINGANESRAVNDIAATNKLVSEAIDGGCKLPRNGVIVLPQKNGLEWRVNATQVANPDGSPVDGTDARQLTLGQIEGHRQVLQVFEFIKQTMPGFEDSYIVDIAPQLGIRETRLIQGEYRLSEEDVLGCADFDDTIGVSGWPVERHVAGDVLIKFPPIPGSRGFTQLPYRMIVPKKVDNLFVAGRCASMTHEGQSAARVTGPCLVMGEAAGTAADLVLSGNTSPREIDVPQLQDRLSAGGVYLGTDL